MQAGTNLRVALGGLVRSDPYLDSASVEFGFRSRRFSHVRALIEAIFEERGTCAILDLGGTEDYWRIAGDFLTRNTGRITVTLANTQPQTVRDRTIFRFVNASATDSDLCGGEHFDLVHSNSVIEHVGDWEQMRRFAANTRAMAPRYFVQTPNFWFPYEPHFRTAGFQYLPRAARVALIRRVALGFFDKVPDLAEARDVIDHHRLLSARQMATLFPDAKILRETIGPFTKSIMAMR